MEATIDEIFVGLELKDNPKRAEELGKLLDRAYDIRKFEIGLFWQRALYFWGFIAASFTAYFLVADKYNTSPHLKLMVTCMGFIFALSWLLINRASTHWKENWEAIIDRIEEELKLPLYKLNIHDSSKGIFKSIFDKSIFDRKHYRISQINIILCYFIVAIWLMLLISSIAEIELCKLLTSTFNNYVLIKTVAILLVTTITTILLLMSVVRAPNPKSENQPQSKSLYLRTDKVTIEKDGQ